MSLRIGWLTPFNCRTGIGTFSKAVTDAMPATHCGYPIDLTVIAPVAAGMYRTRHRFVDISSARPDSRLYDLFDVVVCNIGNNTEHHKDIVEVLRNVPSVIVCHDYVYQHYLATIIHDLRPDFADYVALNARFGRPDALRTIRQSNLTRGKGLVYAPWDSEFSGSEPLSAPLLKLGSALVVHSQFAETYARQHFDGPILRLGMPHDQRDAAGSDRAPAAMQTARSRDGRMTVMSFGHVQSTKCIDEVLQAIASSDRLRESILYVISGFAGSRDYVNHLRALVEDLDLAACVRFELNVSDAELARLSASADAFINLRYPNTEGASVSLIEQLVTAKPVVVLNSGCYAELPDDAVIKVARPRDIGALREAMLHLLDCRESHPAIGQRGRAHAMRYDCQGYVSGFLDFVLAQRDLIRRRASMTARCLVDVETPESAEENDDDEAWIGALEAARTSLDLLDQGRLALDPELLRGIGPEAITDYIQAAILRDGNNQRLTAALRIFLANKRDPYRAARLLNVVHEAGPGGSPEARERLAELCPHGDLAFWDVVASLGPPILATILYHAFFRIPPPDALLETLSKSQSGTSPETAIANAAEQVDRALLACPIADLERLIEHLLTAALVHDAESLQPMPMGRSITIGSAEHDRYLRLSGFFTLEKDHAWTGARPGIVYLRPARGAKRIVVSGHSVHAEAAVSFSATPSLASSSARQGRAHPSSRKLSVFEIALDDLPADGLSPLYLAIHSASCRSPAELGLSDDRRPLGFCLMQIAVS